MEDNRYKKSQNVKLMLVLSLTFLILLSVLRFCFFIFRLGGLPLEILPSVGIVFLNLLLSLLSLSILPAGVIALIFFVSQRFNSKIAILLIKLILPSILLLVLFGPWYIFLDKIGLVADYRGSFWAGDDFAGFVPFVLTIIFGTVLSFLPSFLYRRYDLRTLKVMALISIFVFVLSMSSLFYYAWEIRQEAVQESIKYGMILPVNGVCPDTHILNMNADICLKRLVA